MLVPIDARIFSNGIIKATLCYFYECDRVQGVDYTQRELSLELGIVNKSGIKDINHNTQDEEN